jgi:hypothetical protein
LSDNDPGSSLSTITPASTRHSINASISSSKSIPVSIRKFKRKAFKNPLERGFHALEITRTGHSID